MNEAHEVRLDHLEARMQAVEADMKTFKDALQEHMLTEERMKHKIERHLLLLTIGIALLLAGEAGPVAKSLILSLVGG